MRKRSLRRGHRRGAALVEMAVCLPILVTVVLGIIEFGRAMMVAELVNSAAREGARLAVVAGTTNTEVSDAVKSFLQGTAKIGSQHVAVTITVEPYTGNPNPGDSVANAKRRDLCKVHVDVPFDQVSYTTGKWLKGKQIRGDCAMRHE